MKFTKAEAKYTDHAEHHDERCVLCEHYLPHEDTGATCHRVKGIVRPGGWCRFFHRDGSER